MTIKYWLQIPREQMLRGLAFKMGKQSQLSSFFFLKFSWIKATTPSMNVYSLTEVIIMQF